MAKRPETCGCDESLELRAELNKLKAELVLIVQEKKWAEAERDALEQRVEELLDEIRVLGAG